MLSAIVHDRGLLIGCLLVLAIVACAVIGPLVWRHNPYGISVETALSPPSLAHPMGTDGSGRDVLARFDRGAGISLLAGLAVMLLSALVGGGLGLLSGISGRIVDTLVMRLLDAVLAFPPLILAIAVSIGLGAGLRSAIIGTALTCVPYYARLLRGDVLRIRSLPHVEAAKALGIAPRAIIARHVLPHAAATMLVQSAAVFGYAILTLAGLGFVGLGAQIPTAEWGSMITDGMGSALTGQWWVSVFPGLGLLAAVCAANLLADRIRYLLDPRTTRRAA
jgi:peptide/nickel transport system permease protein